MFDPLIGKKIGQYEIRSLLGQGGMAVVYRAYQAGLDREVAVKIVSKLLTQDKFFLDRFNREVALVARLDHLNIVPVYDHGTTDDGLTYLAMRYIRGGSLADRMQRGQLSLTQIKNWLAQIAHALGYAHEQNVIHRDIKPSNILIDNQGDTYLVDFGLARMIDVGDENSTAAARTITRPSTFMGTPLYMSPEQIEQRTLDARSDLYSLGVVLYEMVTGSPPFAHESAFRVMQMHLSEKPLLPRKLRANVSPGVEQVLLKALEKKPENRFQTADELLKAFTDAVENRNTMLLTGEIFAGDQLPTPRQRRLPFLIGGIALILLLLVVGAFLLRAANPPPISDNGAVYISSAPRPAMGTAADVKLNGTDIERADKVFSGSFIGMVACRLGSDYHASYAAAVRTRAQELGINVKVEDSNNENFKQPQLINSFVAQGAKGIVLCPLNADSIGDALINANKAGVIVVENSDVTPPGGVALTIGNADMGKAAGDYAATLVNKEMGGKAFVAVLGYPDRADITERANAMENALKAGAPGVTIVGHWTGGTTEFGEASMQKAFADHPEINVILSINDAGSYGAVKVLQALSREPAKVMIFSVDAETEAKNMIRNGQYFRGSVDTSPVTVGRLAVDAIVKMIAGGKVPEKIALPLRVVTKDNVDQ